MPPRRTRRQVIPYSSMYPSLTLLLSGLSTSLSFRRCSKPRGCIPARSVRFASNACSASPRSNWG